VVVKTASNALARSPPNDSLRSSFEPSFASLTSTPKDGPARRCAPCGGCDFRGIANRRFATARKSKIFEDLVRCAHETVAGRHIAGLTVPHQPAIGVAEPTTRCATWQPLYLTRWIGSPATAYRSATSHGTRRRVNQQDAPRGPRTRASGEARGAVAVSAERSERRLVGPAVRRCCAVADSHRLRQSLASCHSPPLEMCLDILNTKILILKIHIQFPRLDIWGLLLLQHPTG
jgi:hypothetical protein